MATTKRERNRRLAQIEQRVESVSGDTDTDWIAAFTGAEPATRPEGVHVDTEACKITYDAWEAQQETVDALDSGQYDIVAFLGGYGAGKTVTGARWLLREALTHAESRFLALGVSYSEARGSTYEELFATLPGDRTTTITADFNGPEQSPLVADYNRSEHRLTLVNDTVVVLGSADKWNRLAGDSYGAIWADEPSHYTVDLHDLLEMMGSRLRGEPGPQTMLWTLTGNGFNPAWEILEKREDSDGEPLGHNIDVIRASTLDNPYLSDGEIESFKRQYEGKAREEQALHGGFAAAQGLVYDQFGRDTHVVEHATAVDDVEPAWRVYGYDAGWNDPRVVLEVGKTAYEQLVVLDEYHREGSHVEDARDWLLDKPRGVAYCEHEPSDIRKFRAAGIPARKATKSLDSGIAEVRHRLETDGNRVGLLVSDRCENLIQEFLGYKRDHVGTAAATDHCLDSLRYLCHGMTTGDALTREQSHRQQRNHTGIRSFG